MLRLKLLESSLVAAAVSVSASYACAEDFSAKLSGFNEIGSISATGHTGAGLSDGTGAAKLDLDQKTGTIGYELTFSNVGTTPPKTGTVLFAHIHFGKS